jgi:hypothetical protein
MKMKNLQKLGGFAALYEALAYVLGIVFYLVILDYSGVVEPAQKVALLVDNQVNMFLLTLFVYILFGIFMVFLALALHERLKAKSPALMQTATVFGLFWALVVIASGMIYITGMNTVIPLFGTNPDQAVTVWLAVEAVFEGIGGGVELLGGIWILIISWAALRAGEFPKALNYFGAAIGLAGILTIIPALEMLTDVFGLTQIVWFIWLGIIMLRSKAHTTT